MTHWVHFCFVYSDFVSFYLDDGTIGGNRDVVMKDLKFIDDEAEALGLLLN